MINNTLFTHSLHISQKEGREAGRQEGQEGGREGTGRKERKAPVG